MAHHSHMYPGSVRRSSQKHKFFLKESHAKSWLLPFSDKMAGFEKVERVVLRKGAWPRKSTSCHHMPVAFYAAWLPRSFTLNTLAKTAASPPDIQRLRRFTGIVFAAFAEATTPKGEADPPTAGRRQTRYWLFHNFLKLRTDSRSVEAIDGDVNTERPCV